MQFNNKPLVDQLQKSLTQVNDMLADIEVKIDSERKQLSKTDYDLHQKDTATGFMDYQVSDIWWSTKEPSLKSNPPFVRSPHELKNGMRYKPTVTPTTQEIAIPDIVARWAHSTTSLPALRVRNLTQKTSKSTSSIAKTTTTLSTITTNTPESGITAESFTEPQFIPRISHSIYLKWPLENTPHPGNTEFVHELESAMNKTNYGYFTVGMIKFLEMLATRDPNNTTPVLTAMEEVAGKLLKTHRWPAFYVAFRNDVVVLMKTMNSHPIDELQRNSSCHSYFLRSLI
ncbi:uncharacterized protein LOC113502988 [Trichoplusia ni]|uniref:Uncharacterized protein LOC113502988 n=1 Tax=Trichoplusia ni TaxID=7111 RepID=A0A7E5WIG3_TRINI|nr:uncharacterized protein LOC113502988 [Trichoplusia ni]